MARVKLVSISCLLIFIKGFLINQFDNTPPQNKDTEVVSVRKMCFINLSPVLYQVPKVVNLIVVFSRNKNIRKLS